MDSDTTRRGFIRGGSLAAAGALSGAAAVHAQDATTHQGHEGQDQKTDYPRNRPGPGGPLGSASDRGKLVPGLLPAEQPQASVIVPDVPEKLAWAMREGRKEYHLYCRATRREFLPDLHIDVWGFNGGMPGPTIEAVEGDRVRIVVHNELPESTGIHWHGLELPISQDGVPGLTQDPIRPGETMAYEFDLHQSGTFFYHSHDGMQDGMGMVGLFIISPKAAPEPRVDRDFALLIQEWAILPGATIPNVMSMEFNLFTINGRAAPYITPLVCRLGERVRIRLVNFSAIDHHPMHLHGLTFWVTGTEGGRIPPSAWIPGNTVLVGVAQVREIEFVANNPGDWMLHCHMFHHMMNFMSSMVGPMGGHTVHGMGAGGSMAAGMGMLTGGPALSPELGGTLGRGMGEQTGNDRTVGNMSTGMRAMSGGGGHSGHGAGGRDASGRRVPGFPAGMMDMPTMWTPDQIEKLNKTETRGMRRDWFTGVEGLMSVVRVLPQELYDQVMAGKGKIAPGASVPGSGSGSAHPQGHRPESESRESMPSMNRSNTPQKAQGHNHPS